jgi:hypothetical protein
VVTDRSRAPCTFPLRLLIILPTNIYTQLLKVSRSARISHTMFPLMHPTHVTRPARSACEDEIPKATVYPEQLPSFTRPMMISCTRLETRPLTTYARLLDDAPSKRGRCDEAEATFVPDVERYYEDEHDEPDRSGHGVREEPERERLSLSLSAYRHSLPAQPSPPRLRAGPTKSWNRRACTNKGVRQTKKRILDGECEE